jgi:hypothetical protein
MRSSLKPVIRLVSNALPWLTALVGLSALGYGLWHDRGCPLAWSGGGATAGVAAVIAADRILRRLTRGATAASPVTDPAPSQLQ